MADILRRLRPDTENLPAWFLAELRLLAARCGHLTPAEQRALARQVLSPRAQVHLRTLAMRARVGHRLLTAAAPAQREP
jgi:plasmid stability protein